MKNVLLLTACINPQGMSFTAIQDPKERENQYVEALLFYLNNTTYPIVFINNSGEDISNKISDRNHRIEFLSFHGNDYDKSLGKGYGEFQLLQYAFLNSKVLNQADCVIKVTGRLIIENIKEVVFWNELIFCFPRNLVVVENFDEKNNHVESKFFVASKSFYANCFLKKINNVNDSKGYYFEHLLFDTINECKKKFCVSTMCLPVSIIGISGTCRHKYDRYNYSYGDRLELIMHYCKKEIGERHGLIKLWIFMVLRWVYMMKLFYRIKKKLRLIRI